MSKRFAYSLFVENGQPCLAKLRRGGQRPFRVEWIRSLGGESGINVRPQTGLSWRRESVCQLLPNSEVQMLVTSLPPLNARQIRTALLGNLLREKGGRVSDWVLDFQILPPRQLAGPRRDRRDVSVLFVKRQLVEEHCDGARGLGLAPTALLPGYLAFDLLYRRQRADAGEGLAWSLVHLGHDERFLCVGDEGGLLFARPLPEDLSGGQEREEYVDRLATEIERTNYFAQQAERALQVQKIVVSGEPQLADELVERLGGTAELKVERWRPEELFAWKNGTADWQHTIFLAAAAAGLQGVGYSLLPPGSRQSITASARHYAVLAATTLGAGIVPLLLLGGLWTVQVQHQQLARVTEQRDRARLRADDAAAAYLVNRALGVRQQQVEALAVGRPDLAAVLLDVASRAPAAVRFTNLRLQHQPGGRYQLILEGESSGIDGVEAQEAFLRFLDSLAACDRLETFQEPSYLEILGDEESQRPRSRVIFTLEYFVREEPS